MDRNRIIRTAMLIIAVLCFGYVAVYCVLNYFSKGDSKALSELRRGETEVAYQSDPSRLMIRKNTVLPKYKTLYQKNKNLAGWIKIDNTGIDYPVMQSVNGKGEFYLDHDFSGKEDRNGTLFLDDECDTMLPSTNLIIYGHNMKSGLMFGELDSYKSETFYKNHPVVKFDTLYHEGLYDVAFAFNSKVFSEAEITFKYYQFIEPNSKEEFDSAVKSMREMSIYDTGVEISYGDHLLTLSTCDYDEKNGRFVVVCKRRS